MKDALTPDPSDQHDSDGAAETAFLLPTTNETGEPVESDLTPLEQRALDILGKYLGHRERAIQDSARQLLRDETQLIKIAARNLTGVSILSEETDTCLVLRYRLTEFFAAIPMPPGASIEDRKALRLEALTMLLKLCPQDEAERMLLTQMIASYFASMSCFARAASGEASPELRGQSLVQAQKMSRLYLDIERAFMMRRKAFGAPDPDALVTSPKEIAQLVLTMFKQRGLSLQDDENGASS